MRLTAGHSTKLDSCIFSVAIAKIAASISDSIWSKTASSLQSHRQRCTYFLLRSEQSTSPSPPSSQSKRFAVAQLENMSVQVDLKLSAQTTLQQ
jgi:hypothetical protein